MNTNVLLSNLNDLLNIAKNQNSRNYLLCTLNRLVEIGNLISIELEKVNKSKWQVTFVLTDFNSFNLTDENIYLTSSAFDIKKLNNAKSFEIENDLGSKISYNVL